MNILQLSALLLDEEQAHKYLLRNNIFKTFTYCDKCKSSNLHKISRGRYRCKTCENEWSERKDSILHGQSISASQLIGIIKLFELELTATKAATELCMNERTIQRLYEKIREAIADNANTNTLAGIIKDHTQNFAISIIDGIVNISLDDNTDRANLFNLKRSRVPNKETSFNFIYHGVNSRTIRRKQKDFPVAQNHFWRFANEKMLKFRGTKLSNLYLYLKEIEFRYNNHEDIYNKLIAKIAHFEGWR